MSRRCELTGKGVQVGHRVSHSNIKTKHRFLPNLHTKRFWSELKKKFITLKVSTAAIRTIDKVGLDIKNFDFTLDGNGKLTLVGECNTKADYEKVALTAGNIVGVAEVDNNMTIASAETVAQPDSTYYTVEKADSLWKIAEANYQDGSKYNLIFEANVPMIKDADEIYPGQVLRIPALPA